MNTSYSLTMKKNFFNNIVSMMEIDYLKEDAATLFTNVCQDGAVPVEMIFQDSLCEIL